MLDSLMTIFPEATTLETRDCKTARNMKTEVFVTMFGGWKSLTIVTISIFSVFL